MDLFLYFLNEYLWLVGLRVLVYVEVELQLLLAELVFEVSQLLADGVFFEPF